MQLQLQTWNSHNIQDGSLYSAYIPLGQLHSLTSKSVYVDRAGDFSFFSTVVLSSNTLTIKVQLLSGQALHLGQQIIMGWFAINDSNSHQLVAYDTADSSRSWYVSGKPTRVVMEDQVTVAITLSLDDPMWRVTSLSSSSWTISNTGDTKNITVRGNTPAKPKFAIQPTNARVGGYAYKRWVPIYNQVARPFVNYPYEITQGGLNTAALVNDTSVSNQINQIGGIDAVVTTIPIDTSVGGGLASAGMGYVGTEQISWTGNTGTNLTGVTRGIGGTTAAVHADNAVIARSKTLANGDDFRVVVDGAEVNRWFGTSGATTYNSTGTLIWDNLNFSPKQIGTLKTALPNNSTTVTVVFNKTAANLLVLKALATAANPIFLIGTEAFSFTPSNVDLVNYQIASCLRAQKGTSAASHSANANILWVEHDIWAMYGNSGSLTPDTDDTKKPLLNLASSSNTSWVSANYFDTSSARPGAFTGNVEKSLNQNSPTPSVIYTGNQTALADPATELGCEALAFQFNNAWKAETVAITWGFYIPSGITTVAYSGSKYLYNLTGWPSVAGLQKAKDGKTWVTAKNDTAPTSAQTWTSFGAYSQSLSGTYQWIRFALIGNIPAIANNQASIQFDTITLTLDNTTTPVGTFNSETTNYYLNCKISNQTANDPHIGEYLQITYPMLLNDTLTVDCDAKTVTLSDGSPALGALVLSTNRAGWLDIGSLNMGATAGSTTTLQFDDIAGSSPGSITCTVSWRDRML